VTAFKGLPMDPSRRESIKEIKSRIAMMLEERQRLTSSSSRTASPSKFWSDFCSFFDYLPSLPDEAFANLRLHTYHLTGDTYQSYYFKSEIASMRARWEELIRDVPAAYVLREPEGGIGFSYDDGTVVSRDVMRCQRVVNTLYDSGTLTALANAGGQRKLVLEIGAGYGGLAHQLSNLLGNTTYVIVDLPETMLFSASYLALLNPGKKLYLYRGDDFPKRGNRDFLTAFDFVLIPNYKLDELRDLRFDLVLNVASLQEMRADQVAEYLDFISDTCKGVFYSWNQDDQPENSELGNLSKMLRARFELAEVVPKSVTNHLTARELMVSKLKELLQPVGIRFGVLKPFPAGRRRYVEREYLCRPFGLRSNS